MIAFPKRPSLLTGLVVFILGIWASLQLNLLRVDYSRIVLRTRYRNHDKELSTTHAIVRSASTSDGTYFQIDWLGQSALNPNIIPHPVIEETWIVVAQLGQESQHFAELVCNAIFDSDVLKCIDSPVHLPISPTNGGNCTEDLAYFELSQGPHDARVFHGPKQPYTIYGSNSHHTCFGQWVHDFRRLMDWGHGTDASIEEFSVATELQRPPPWNPVEKNWFLFWDVDGNTYAHYDLFPRRAFARVDTSGAVATDLSFLSEEQDNTCMQKHMPKLGPELESIHQATNSLSITMCRRDDMWCTPDISNTFIFIIFQHKTYFNFHAVYEPYVLVFEQTPPFKIRAISRKPIWVSGRRKTQSSDPSMVQSHSDSPRVAGHSDREEMLYITSMSWKNQGQKYQGHIDDTLFIAFGVEDETTAAIDIVAGDLLQDLAGC